MSYRYFLLHFQVFLGDYSDEHFIESEAQDAISSFQAHLKEISAAIHKRNQELEFPYLYLLPERIPNSITA